MQPHMQEPQGQGQQYAPGAYTVDPRAQLTAGVDQFMARVNAWMAAGVGITALVAYVASTNLQLMQLLFGTPLRWVVLFGPFAFVWIFASRIHDMQPNKAIGLFFVYAAMIGLMLSGIFIVYSLGSIVSVFVITSVMYGSLALFGFVTKRDLGPMGKFLFMAAMGLMAMWLFFLFVPSMAGGTMYFVWNVGGVVIFAGLTAYHTQKLKQLYLTRGGGGNLAVLGALTLYSDFINLFLFLLRLFGGGRD